MNEHESLVAAVKQADVVISAVGHHHGPQELHQGQLNIVAAIKQAGNVKRFVPSEYGMDVEQGLEAVVEPARSMLLVGKVRCWGYPKNSEYYPNTSESSRHVQQHI
jgi:5-methylthioribose kinase